MTDKGLTFRIGEVAKIFDRSISWLRWRERDQEIFTNEDGSKIVVGRSDGNYREYTLDDLDAINDALLRHGTITKAQHESTARKVAAYR